MHQCLSCNQPCSLFSAFCDACRATLLARREAEAADEQLDMVKVGGGSDGEGGYEGWEMGEGMADLRAFPRPEAPQVGSHVGARALSRPEAARADVESEQAYTDSAGPVEEKGVWTFETSGIYAMETMNKLAEKDGVEAGAGAARAAHGLALPPRAWQRVPRNVKQALLVFCVVGVVAFLTDGILLALSLTHHRAPTSTSITQPGAVEQQVASPLPGMVSITPTVVIPVSAFALSVQHISFSAAVGQVSLASQAVSLSGLHQGSAWRVEPVNTSPAWLHLAIWQGSAGSGSTSLTIGVRPAGLVPGFYTTSLLVRAFDTQGQSLVGSPETLAVALTIRPPCALSIAPTKLSFGSVLGSVPASQTLTLNASSACSFPLTWRASSDASWLTFARSSGTFYASGGSIVVQASSAGKLIGPYYAHLTVSGIDSFGRAFSIEPGTVSVVLTVIA
ncbi:MAG TPA: hypothetical protein VGD98_15115 [Ktedonobacteraceae bacterium]